ncbi:MAG TPA: transposase [Saprospiraceae bacterium]|nr:transposase [Saprospiraceae bacterium]
MSYLHRQWPKIERAAQDARFEMDNNLIENKIRPLALGRKNYLFAGSHDGAVRAAMMYSFFGTCKAKGINPYDWLVDTLNKIPSHPINRIQDLLPGYIQINDV